MLDSIDIFSSPQIFFLPLRYGLEPAGTACTIDYWHGNFRNSNNIIVVVVVVVVILDTIINIIGIIIVVVIIIVIIPYHLRHHRGNFRNYNTFIIFLVIFAYLLPISAMCVFNNFLLNVTTKMSCVRSYSKALKRSCIYISL